MPPLTGAGLPEGEPSTKNWTKPSEGLPLEEATVAVNVADWPKLTEAVPGVIEVEVANPVTVSLAVVSAAVTVAA